MSACDATPGLISLEAAIERLERALIPLTDSESVPLQEAYGRSLAEDLLSPIDLPIFTNSAMDGYALRAEDGAPMARLKVVGHAWAGAPYEGVVHSGECVRIFTGAYLPEDCDAVIMQEETVREGDTLKINRAHPLNPDSNVRRQGEELQTGDCLLKQGQVLDAASLGLLAAAGCREIWVKRKLRVAFFSTGDELRDPGETLEPGQIYESNRIVLQALLEELGIIGIDLGVVRDNRDTLRETFQRAATQADAVLSSGGASVGEADFVAEILAELGRVNFWKVAIKPGKPFLFGHANQTPVMGLPGNPVSLMVTFRQLVRPALCRMAGLPTPVPLRFPAISRTAIRKSPGRLEFQRGVWESLNGRLEVTPLGSQGSHRLTSMSRANCFIMLPRECDGIAAGERVTIEPFASPWG